MISAEITFFGITGHNEHCFSVLMPGFKELIYVVLPRELSVEPAPGGYNIPLVPGLLFTVFPPEISHDVVGLKNMTTIFEMPIENKNGGPDCASINIEDHVENTILMSGFGYDGFAILTHDEAVKLGEFLIKWGKSNKGGSE